jgi:hypothetical protein
MTMAMPNGLPVKKHTEELTASPKIKDPHHGGSCEWCFHKGSFYHRHGINQWWTKVKNVSLTPSRIKALCSLLAQAELIGHTDRIDQIRGGHNE